MREEVRFAAPHSFRISTLSNAQYWAMFSSTKTATQTIEAPSAAMKREASKSQDGGWIDHTVTRKLGREDSNFRMAESKSAALPLGYAPTRDAPDYRFCDEAPVKRTTEGTSKSSPLAARRQ